MTNRKNQNSILVLATLGVYLGLVLAGATPQVLANAAMTRQFDVKDEIEVKDDLDKKPDNVSADLAETTASEIDHKITRSVERFLAKFKTVDSINSICSSPDFVAKSENLRWQPGSYLKPYTFHPNVPIGQNITVSNLPRAGLDTPLASNVK